MCLLMWDLLTDPKLYAYYVVFYQLYHTGVQTLHLSSRNVMYFPPRLNHSDTWVILLSLYAVDQQVFQLISQALTHSVSLSSFQFSLAFIYFLFSCLTVSSEKAAMNRKAVLITGCSSGIGLALAVRLAKDEKKRFMGKVHRISIVI